MTLSVDSSRFATDSDHRWPGRLRDPDWRDHYTHSAVPRPHQAATTEDGPDPGD